MLIYCTGLPYGGCFCKFRKISYFIKTLEYNFSAEYRENLTFQIISKLDDFFILQKNLN